MSPGSFLSGWSTVQGEWASRVRRWESMIIAGAGATDNAALHGNAESRGPTIYSWDFLLGSIVRSRVAAYHSAAPRLDDLWEI
jgi:hypothetical protein